MHSHTINCLLDDFHLLASEGYFRVHRHKQRIPGGEDLPGQLALSSSTPIAPAGQLISLSTSIRYGIQSPLQQNVVYISGRENASQCGLSVVVCIVLGLLRAPASNIAAVIVLFCCALCNSWSEELFYIVLCRMPRHHSSVWNK
jgi:hypothetical protein